MRDSVVRAGASRSLLSYSYLGLSFLLFFFLSEVMLSELDLEFRIPETVYVNSNCWVYDLSLCDFLVDELDQWEVVCIVIDASL